MERDREKMRIYREEEEGEKEINEYCQMLQYMRESCSGTDDVICRLIEEQWEVLWVIRMRTEEFLDTLKGLHVWEAAVLRKKL